MRSPLQAPRRLNLAYSFATYVPLEGLAAVFGDVVGDSMDRGARRNVMVC